jgi:hypothetical protein
MASAARKPLSILGFFRVVLAQLAATEVASTGPCFDVRRENSEFTLRRPAGVSRSADWRSYLRFTSTSSASSRDFNSAFSFSSFRVFASSALMPARVTPSASTELIVVGPRPTPKAL